MKEVRILIGIKNYCTTLKNVNIIHIMHYPKPHNEYLTASICSRSYKNYSRSLKFEDFYLLFMRVYISLFHRYSFYCCALKS